MAKTAKNWFSMQARAAGTARVAEVDIYDEIGGWGITAKDFKLALDEMGDVERIQLNIHSPGGSVIEGLAMYNLLKGTSVPVHARIDGLIASMATVLVMAADTVEMPENAFFMIHNVKGGAVGESDDLRSYAEIMEKMQGQIVNIYAAKTGQESDYIASLMESETWMTGTEAKELGFVDTMTESLEMAALSGVVDGMKEVLAKAGTPVPELVDNADESEDEPTAEDPAPETTEGAEDTTDEAAEESEESEPETTDHVEEPAADDPDEQDDQPKGFIERFTAALSGRSDVTAARAETAQLRGQLETLTGQLATRDGELAEALAERDTLQAKVDTFQAERRTVMDLVCEAGFAPDQAASLPLPDSDEDGEKVGATIREQFSAITDPDERRAFYQKHKAALLHP